MAERRESPENSSPAKRLRLDSTADGAPNENAEAYVSPEIRYNNLHYIPSLRDFCTKRPIPESNPPAEGVEDDSRQFSLDHIVASPIPDKNYNPITVHDKVAEDDDEADDDDDDADSSSTVSDLSDLSGISDISDYKWRPKMSKAFAWIQQKISQGVNPRSILGNIGNFEGQISPMVDDCTLWGIIASLLSEPPKREKIPHINTILDVVQLLKSAKNIVVLTGAGVSVSCGIPDFRSRDGIYSRLAVDFPDLPDPQAMFDITYFRHDPRPFYKFAREIYPGQFKPSPCHKFLKRLELSKKLLRNYTQNIDTLEQVAGIENVIECHGSFATASCTRCKAKVSSDTIKNDILEQKIPYCAKCKEQAGSSDASNGPESISDLYSQGIMKPDIVFFGEGLPEAFHDSMAADKNKCDLLIVIGSSLKVRPVALIPNSIPATVPQILINRERLPHLNFDVELLGDCDVIINQLCHLMDDEWRSQCWLNPLGETTKLEDKVEIVNQWVDRQAFVLPSTSSESRSEEVVQPMPKDRHYSTDSMLSAGDSGISGGASSDSPTCSEVSSGRDSRQCSTESMRSASCDEPSTSPARHMSVDSLGSPPALSSAAQADDLDAIRWQPKAKESIAERLADNSYYFKPPNQYIFPGAEVYSDSDDSSYPASNHCGSDIDSEEEEDKTEHQTIDPAPLP